MLRVPEPSASEDEWEVAEEEPALPPRPKKSSKSKKGKKSRSSASGFKGGLKKGFGVLAIVLGLAIGAGIGYMAFAGGKPRALRGLVIPFVMVAMGIAWVKGETYGG